MNTEGLAPAPEEPVSLHPAIKVIKEKMSPEKAEEVRKIRLLIGEDELEKIANTPEPAPKWRELLPKEEIHTGDQVQAKHHDRIHGVWIDVFPYEVGAMPIDHEAFRYRTRRPLPKQEEERPLEKEQVVDYCRKWADEHLAGHGKETFYSRLGLLVDFATDFYSDKIEHLKKNQK
jgi:hypothetical protein